MNKPPYVWTSKAYEALLGSIKKWEAIVDGTGYDNRAENCPLCAAFLNVSDYYCAGCPVAHKTGYSLCEETPYRAFRMTADSLVVGPSNVKVQIVGQEGEGKEGAQAMLDFLVALKDDADAKESDS